MNNNNDSCIKEYPLMVQQGIISIEQKLKIGITTGDLGIQISKDGRIWVYINRIAFLRFRPMSREQLSILLNKDEEK